MAYINIEVTETHYRSASIDIEEYGFTIDHKDDDGTFYFRHKTTPNMDSDDGLYEDYEVADFISDNMDMVTIYDYVETDSVDIDDIYVDKVYITEND